MSRQPLARYFPIAALVTLLGFATAPTFGQGIAISGVGAVNRAMGGAATAAPIDSSGALMWNPATISGLESSEMMWNLEVLLPTQTVESSVAANTFGAGVPPIPLSGSTRAESGVTPVPALSWVHKTDSPWTVGLGVFGAAGFGLNYPSSNSNPVLMPAPPYGIGLGSVNAQAEMYQIIPTASYAVTDRLSVGFAPTITLQQLVVDPFVLGAPNNANGDGTSTYSTGVGTRRAWGGGFQVGLYYITERCWHFGVSYKSRQWTESMRFFAEDELGRPQVMTVRFDHPQIVSLGSAYTGFDRWLLAADVRYYNYAGTPGYGDVGYRPDGSLAGLGWNDVWSVHLGAQRQVTDRLYLRGGYSYNGNPIDSTTAFFNVGAPLIYQHTGTLGASFHVTSQVIVSGAYVHYFENEVTGPWNLPGIGPVPGTSVTNKLYADSLVFGMTVRY